MESRQQRIRDLRRKEERNKNLLKIISDVSGALTCRIQNDNVFDIEQIDRHEVILNSTDFKFNYLNLSFPKSKIDTLRVLISRISSADLIILSLPHSSEIAIFTVPLFEIINSFEKLIDLDGDTVCVYDLEYKNGLMIDLNEDHWFLDGELRYLWIYELRVFGIEWIKAITQDA